MTENLFVVSPHFHTEASFSRAYHLHSLAATTMRFKHRRSCTSKLNILVPGFGLKSPCRITRAKCVAQHCSRPINNSPKEILPRLEMVVWMMRIHFRSGLNATGSNSFDIAEATSKPLDALRHAMSIAVPPFEKRPAR